MDTERAKQKRMMNLQRRADVCFTGLRVCSRLSDSGSRSAELSALMRVHGMQDVELDHLWDAKLYVVDDPMSPGQRVQWAAQLTGGSVANRSFLLSLGATGVCIPFKRATATPRQVCMTHAFKESHPVITQILTSAMTMPGSRWRRGTLHSFKEFNERDARRPKAQRRPLDYVALVTLKEKTKDRAFPYGSISSESVVAR
eukprot:15151220-Alexandrium_andersonii.AAC.1